ncbi:transcription factor [Saccharomycopsis crataegensis]|uniref:Transcription factor n=1 Tax=Saccharomycopsis crataegensis TaxID=43959 RepID=A0AAV5QFZ6_9ASCO|nr:transcription factor [Saccharomycopsis crataegensis]
MSDLPNITSTLPPRKRAKTQEEKEQRRIERILRNRRAAHASREKKRKHVEFLEASVHKLESNINLYKSKEAKLIELSEKLLSKFKELGGDSESSDLDLSILSESPIPDIDLNQAFFGDAVGKSSSDPSTPAALSPSATGASSLLADDITMVSDPVSAQHSRSASPAPEESTVTPTETTITAESTGKKSTNSVTKTKSKKTKKTKAQEIESPIPTSPLSTPLIKHNDYTSPFKNTNESSTEGFVGSTLDITTDYMSSASSTFSGESRGSPISNADSLSTTNLESGLNVDEYLSNLTNPMFIPSDSYDKPQSDWQFFERNLNQNSSLSQNNGLLGDPFDDDVHVTTSTSSRLHNPAAVYYDFSF